MYEIIVSARFKKKKKKCQKRRFDPANLKEVVDLLANGEKLPARFKDHKLNDSKQFKDVRECHVEEPDTLLVYRTSKKQQILWLYRLGTHEELF